MMILLTGATGFLGHNLVPRLLEAGYGVRALVRRSSNTQFLEQLGVELAYTPDISDQTAVLEACRGCDYVVHAAGRFRFWGDEADFYRINVDGTAAVLAAALAANVQKVVHISTIAVVGATGNSGEITETSPCNPLEPYQKSKLAGEQLALSYYRDKGLPVVVLRPGAFYGPWGQYAFNRLFFEEPMRGWRIKVNNGRNFTFPVFVPDVVQGIQLALQKGQAGEIYNICGRSVDHQTVNTIVSDLGGIGRWRVPMPKAVVLLLARSWTALSRFTGREPFYPINLAPYVFQNWLVSSAKAEKELGFEPTPFAVGAKATLEWYWEAGLLPH